MAESQNERWFDNRCKVLGLEEPTREYRFSYPRKWRFDRAWIKQKIGLELEGYGHARFNRYHGDVLKYNRASELGWRIFRITYLMVQKDDVSVLETIVRLLGSGGGDS